MASGRSFNNSIILVFSSISAPDALSDLFRVLNEILNKYFAFLYGLSLIPFAIVDKIFTSQ